MSSPASARPGHVVLCLQNCRKEGFFSCIEGRINLLPQHGLLVPLGGTGPGWRQEEQPSLQQASQPPREAVVPPAGGGGVWHAAIIHIFTTPSHRPPLPGEMKRRAVKATQLGTAEAEFKKKANSAHGAWGGPRGGVGGRVGRDSVADP